MCSTEWEIWDSMPPEVFTVDRDLNHLEEFPVVDATDVQIDDIPLPSASSGWEMYE